MVSVEAKQGIHSAKDKYVIPPYVDRFLKSPTGKFAVRYLIDRVYTYAPERLFKWEGLDNLSALGDPGFRDKKIVLVAKHISHGDGAEVVSAIGKIDQKAPGRFDKKVYTVAGSMGYEQGPLMAALWNNGVKPYFEKKGITPDAVVSENDIAERGMERPESNGILTKESMLNPDAINVVHIEGSTKGGKTNPETGRNFGLQHMDRGFNGVLLQQLRHKIPTYILPLVIEGSEFYFDPNKRGFSKEGMMELFKMLTVGNGTIIGNLDSFLVRSFFKENGDLRRGRVAFGELASLQALYTNRSEFEDNVMTQLAKISSEVYLGDYGRKLLRGS